VASEKSNPCHYLSKTSIMGVIAEVLSSVLLFSLVFGMSATVDIRHIFKQLRNWQALLIGVSLQFVVLPFIGFLVVKILDLDAVVGITLLVITSSPGGSYSNWWCSMFNADLALSVTMTAISTLLSVVMLPINLLVYTRWTYSADVVDSLDWTALFVSLVTVCTGIASGLTASAISARWGPGYSQRFHVRANRLGNLAGLALITLSVTVSSSDHKAAVWDQDASFYIGVALPAFCGLAIATYLSSRCRLDKPERVAVSVEACYQNTGIATSVALTMFSSEEDLATAIGVPLYYGIVEAVMLAVFCLICWKLNWTKAPADENLCTVISNSYEVEETREAEQEVSIEVVLGQDDEVPNNLVFEQTDDGAYIVDEESLHKFVYQKKNKESPSEKCLPDEEDKIEELEPTEHSDTSVGDNYDHDGADVVPGLRRQRRLYAQVAAPAPSSPTVTESSHSSSNDMEVDSSSNAVEATVSAPHGRLGRTLSSLHARATGYRKAPLPEDGAYEEEDARIKPLAMEDQEQTSSAYQSIAVSSPLSSSLIGDTVPAEGRTFD
jgi:predicted Na+-dependent transporter